MKAKKIMAVLVIAIMLIGIVSVPVLASTNEKVILKNSDNEYLIYFKEFCRKEFQFAISKDSKTAEADLNFVNSAKDQPASVAGTLNVAYIDEASFESIFGKNPTSLVAYIWVKDAEDNTVIKADKLDLNEAVTDKMIETVNGTTKRIDVDTEKQYQRNVVEDGVSKTVTVGKVVLNEKEGAKYSYVLTKLDNKTTGANKLFELADTLKNSIDDTYTNLSLSKQFYDLYVKLMPSDSEWTAVENSEILQPENTVDGDKYIVYIKETKGNDETVDAKFLTCVYKEDAGVDKEEKTITETVKLPVTFDSGAILFTILGIIIIALAIFVFIRIKSNKKDENK